MKQINRIIVLMLFMILGGMLSTATAAEQWVPFTEANFPDATFRQYLTTAQKNALSPDNKQINVLGITNINISSETYKALKSLEGIKLFKNLKYLYLPGKGSSQRAFSLTSIDVSGMPMLEIIDNGLYTTTKETAREGLKELSASNDGATGCGSCELASFTADDCPRLRYVAIGGTKYKNLKTISLNGSTSQALEALYISSDAIETLDLSKLTKLENKLRTTGTTGAYTTLTNKVNKFSNFAITSCKNLKTLILGEHPLWTGLSIHLCPEIETLDISGLPNLEGFTVKANSTSSATSNESPRGAGKLNQLVMAENYPNLKTFELYQTSMRELDTRPFEKTVTSFTCRGSFLSKLDVTRLVKATAIDISFNYIHDIDLPPLTSCKAFYFKYNRATFIPYPGDTHKSLATTSNGDYHEQIVNVGKQMRVKIIDNPEDAQYLMKDPEENPQMPTHPSWKEPYAGWFGDPAKGEDPCYFYFENDFTDGEYWFYFPNTYATSGTNKGKPSNIVSYVKVTLSRNEPDEFDQVTPPKPEIHEFYLAGDYNNWTPTEADRFTAMNEDEGTYQLELSDKLIAGEFRVWNATTREAATLDFGGHTIDKNVDAHPDYTGGKHIFFEESHYYTLGTNKDLHFTTHPNQDKGLVACLANPHFYMRYQGEESQAVVANDQYPYNYLTLHGGVITGVDGIYDGDDTPVRWYDLQGVEHDGESLQPGIYIRVQGGKSEKVFVD